MKYGISFIIAVLCTANIYAQQVTTFEMRYLTSDAKANGVTDFHGETEVFDTEQRIEALNNYAD